jgi:CubicO group peptidase (beta-lactamase class C family)
MLWEPGMSKFLQKEVRESPLLSFLLQHLMQNMKFILSFWIISYSLYGFAPDLAMKKLDHYMLSKVEKEGFSGTVLVAKNNKIVYSRAFGYADRELNVKNSIQTKYRIGSITKQFTAAAILKLTESNALSLQDKLSKFFPSYLKGDSISIHMLLNHSSGIKNYTNLPAFEQLFPLALAKDSIIALFKNQSLDFKPGTQWRYSNSGYFLLGCIVEQVSGQDFGQYIKKNLLIPAGLLNTSMDRPDFILHNRAKGYHKEDKIWKNASYISMEFPFSAGALVSTVNDLYLWNKALHQGNLLQANSKKQMMQAYLGEYGYGLFVNKYQNKLRIGHTGGIPGFISHLDYYPTEKLHVIVLANYNADSQKMAADLAKILFSLHP